MTVFARGIDYAWEHPDPAAIAAAGYTFACRYLSRDPSKNITPAEAKALAACGVWVVANWEYGAQDMLGGYAGGIADAQLAQQQARAAGMPEGRPIYFSADWDVTPAQEPTVLAYLSGVTSVLGPREEGEYGGYYPVKAARDAGIVWTWQTFAWSGGQWDARDTVRQIGSATVGGVQVDVNEALAADYGQWQPGRLPDITEADMPLTDADAALIENRPLGVIASPATTPPVKTTLGVETASNPARWAQLFARLDALKAAAATPVDAKALAAAVVAGLTPVVDAAVKAGTPIDYDHLAIVVENHLAATLATPK